MPPATAIPAVDHTLVDRRTPITQSPTPMSGPPGSCRQCLTGGAQVGLLDLAPHETRPQVLTPEDADRLIRPLVVGRDREHGLLLSMDARNRLIAVDLISVGTACNTFMSPREVFRDALLRGASAIFIAHNHPSGDPSPSPSDRNITRRLKRAGSTLGIQLLDHLIIGDGAFVSLERSATA